MRFLKTDEDLFRESTMSFGDHLEELRACLFRAIFGLAIGFVIGLLIGDRVVRFIQTPVESALDTYFQNQALNTLKETAQNKGGDSPTEGADKFMSQEGYLADTVFVDIDTMLADLRQLRPEEFKTTVKPSEKSADGKANPEIDAPDPKKLARLILWRRKADDPRVKLRGLSVMEAFSIYLRASMLVGVILSSPWIFWQIWSFVASGLYSHERHYVRIYLPASLGLFLAGAALAFFFVFPPVLQFLFGFNAWLGIEPDTRVSEWMNFVLMMPLAFGITFQMPLVMLFLQRIGIFTVEAYLSQWRVAILVIAIVAAVFTPSPDPWSMMLMGAPLVALYFGGILLCKHMPAPNRSEFADRDED
jgi:sec-independent protein translocase protein TatC